MASRPADMETHPSAAAAKAVAQRYYKLLSGRYWYLVVWYREVAREVSLGFFII